MASFDSPLATTLPRAGPFSRDFFRGRESFCYAAGPHGPPTPHTGGSAKPKPKFVLAPKNRWNWIPVAWSVKGVLCWAATPEAEDRKARARQVDRRASLVAARLPLYWGEDWWRRWDCFESSFYIPFGSFAGQLWSHTTPPISLPQY